MSLRNLWVGLGGAAIGAVIVGFAVHLSDTSEISRLSASQAATDAKLQELQKATNEQKGDKASFAAAVAKDLDQEGLLCLGFEKFPVDVFRNGDTVGMVGTGVQMTALEKVRLVNGTSQMVEQKAMFGNSITQQPVTRYALTPEAEPFLHHPARTIFGETSADAKDLCYGKRVLDQVVDWEGPMTMGSYAEATVVYAYKIDGIASWAADADVQKAFPNVPRLLHPESGMKGRVVLKKTALGWSAKGLD